VTKAQFENLVNALNPEMPATVRRQLAESYPHVLLFAKKARELGLDQDPRFAESMRFSSMQILTQRLNLYFEQQASSISDSDVEKYYRANAIKFERAELLRIVIPRQKTVSAQHSSPAVDSPMLAVAGRRLPATPERSFRGSRYGFWISPGEHRSNRSGRTAPQPPASF
jgi:hypothetical protein